MAKTEEIEQAVHRLKSKNSPGNDQVMNEYICSTLSIFLTFYEDCSNLIFDAGVVPEEWLTGIVKPIYKKKGDPHLPDNYRSHCLAVWVNCSLVSNVND